MDIVKTESAMAFLTIEVDMGVFVVIGVMAVTQLIPGSFHIFYRMHEMVILESHQAPEYS